MKVVEMFIFWNHFIIIYMFNIYLQCYNTFLMMISFSFNLDCILDKSKLSLFKQMNCWYYWNFCLCQWGPQRMCPKVTFKHQTSPTTPQKSYTMVWTLGQLFKIKPFSAKKIAGWRIFNILRGEGEMEYFQYFT